MWCPGCSQEVESKCHHWMCPIARDERNRERQMSELTEDEAREPTLTYVAKLEARIEALEATLRTIRFEIDSQCGPLTLDTPQTALAPEQNK